MTIEIKQYKQDTKHLFFEGQEFYYTPIINGVEYSHVAPNPDIAYLIALSIKYEGNQASNFAMYASRMLNIPGHDMWDK